MIERNLFYFKVEDKHCDNLKNYLESKYLNLSRNIEINPICIVGDDLIKLNDEWDKSPIIKCLEKTKNKHDWINKKISLDLIDRMYLFMESIYIKYNRTVFHKDASLKEILDVVKIEIPYFISQSYKMKNVNSEISQSRIRLVMYFETFFQSLEKGSAFTTKVHPVELGYWAIDFSNGKTHKNIVIAEIEKI